MVHQTNLEHSDQNDIIFYGECRLRRLRVIDGFGLCNRCYTVTIKYFHLNKIKRHGVQRLLEFLRKQLLVGLGERQDGCR